MYEIAVCFKWVKVDNGLAIMGENRKINFTFFYAVYRQGKIIIDNLILLAQ